MWSIVPLVPRASMFVHFHPCADASSRGDDDDDDDDDHDHDNDDDDDDDDNDDDNNDDNDDGGDDVAGHCPRSAFLAELRALAVNGNGSVD